MTIGSVHKNLLEALERGSRELIEQVEEDLQSFAIDVVHQAMIASAGSFRDKDIVVFADLLLILGWRQDALAEYRRWLSDHSASKNVITDLIPLSRTWLYAGKQIRARIVEIAHEPAPSDFLERFIVRSASASAGDWPSCLACHDQDIQATKSSYLAEAESRLIGLSVLAHAYMILYREAVFIAKRLVAPACQWTIADGPFSNFADVLAHVRRRLEELEQIMAACATLEQSFGPPASPTNPSAVRLDRVDIFIKTYKGDQQWLEWCLKSIARFASGFRRVVIISDQGHSFKDVILPNSTYLEIPLPPARAPLGVRPGYLSQQVAKLNWHRYTDADAVMMLDSDTILSRAVKPSDFFRNGQPVWYYGKWDLHGGKKWRPGSEVVVGRDVEFSFMREHPFFLTRQATKAFHSHVERRFGQDIEWVYFNESIPAVISEFECFGAFLGTVDPCGYALEEIFVPRNFVVQHWSWGGLDQKTELSLKLLVDEGGEDQITMEKEAMSYKNMSIEDRSKLDPLGEMELFRAAELWDGGYLDSDPLEPVGWSSYSTTGYVSVYHAAYLACIKPYVSSKTVAMEIGPGRGAWTKAILSRGAERIFALDVQARETNVIDSVLGNLSSKLEYIVVSDFSGSGVPEGAVDFFWSFGTFVHLSRGQQKAYYETIARKMKPGAVGFVQYADIPTWNRVVTNPNFHIHNILADRLTPDSAEQMRELLAASRVIAPRETVEEHIADYHVPDPGRYFYVGTDWVVETLQSFGLEVFDRSVFDNLRDPLIGFRKP